VNTHPLLMDLANQRQAELAARARSARPRELPEPENRMAAQRRTDRRERSGVATRLRMLVSRA
jgi:hypothetical protein